MIEVNGVIYRNLEEQVQKNKEDIESLQNAQSGDDSDIEQINNKITQIETLVNSKANQSSLDSTNQNVAQNTNNITTINSKITTINGQISNIDSQINNLNTNKANQSSLNTTNQNVTQNTNSITTINGQITTINGKITTINGQISSIDSQINNLNTNKANQSSLDSTNQNVAQNTTKITQIETDLTEITPDVMRALKTPLSTPSTTKIVAVDTTNSQEMLTVGAGLVIENGTLKSTGGTQIIDNLTSTSISAGLSANQGRVLDGKISSLETLVGTKANQSSLNTTNQNVTQNTNSITTINGQISTINGQISNIDSQTSSNTEQIEFLQSDVAGKTNVTIGNVHQDNVNFTSDPQTQINNLNTNKANKDLSNVTYPQVVADGMAKTGAGDRVIESNIASDGNSWYRVWESGWKECGGRFDVPSSGAVHTHTMPVAFTSETSYFVIGIRNAYANSSANANIGTVCINQLTNQTIQVQTYNGPYTFYACGW